MDTGTLPLLLALLVALAVGLAVGALVGHLWSRARDAEDSGSRAGEAAVLGDGLGRLEQQLTDLSHDRARWEASLSQHVTDVRHSTDQLRRETLSLSTALRKPQVRGRWGEMHLRRAVELAGLVDRCDFEEQVRLEGGALRPDVVVRLAGGRSVVVDAKVPLDAYLDATEAGAASGQTGDGPTADADPASPRDAEESLVAEREHHLRRHAAQLRAHVDTLAAKRYWRALPTSPEFVVLFVPGESFLAAALDADPRLLDDAAQQRVVLATPTTLIALLRTVALGWTQAGLADQAQAIHTLGRDLHARLATLTKHLDQVGRSLGSSVNHFNKAVGSYEGRVLVAARRFDDLGLGEDALEAPQRVEHTPRPLSPPADSASTGASNGASDGLAALDETGDGSAYAAREDAAAPREAGDDTPGTGASAPARRPRSA